MGQKRHTPEQIIEKLRRAEESFSGKLRDELLNVELFDTLLEARALVEPLRALQHSRPHSALGCRLPAPEALQPCPPGPGYASPFRQH